MNFDLDTLAQWPFHKQVAAIALITLSVNAGFAVFSLLPLHQQLATADLVQLQHANTLKQQQQRLKSFQAESLATRSMPLIDTQPSASLVVAELNHLARQHQLVVRQLEWVVGEQGSRIELNLVGRFQSIGDFCQQVSELTSLVRIDNGQWQQLNDHHISFRAQVLGDWREESDDEP
ncbi:type 4a pilus biogenesis protein PilO [Vibrio sinaloensis]|uniref:type 4a pilus biogenesis protein PilO n=1 Tax=Photobacterium sp. (strain ATCC 43367) TaxID=379097 RepID=UPI002055728E|nr:type 4a pilus biogenesis protein PilO [Vibrio sinaloensis]UPQ88181.1 type 4a pilus biogenesis protein PilO [Vibrio sinaloensis]